MSQVDVWRGSLFLARLMGLLLVVFWSFGLPTAHPVQAASISFHWNGTASTVWKIYDATGQKDLGTYSCDPGKTRTVDIAPGDYQIKLTVPGYQLFKVSTGMTLTPEVGQVALHWNGAARVIWEIYDATGQQIISSYWCEPGETRIVDIAPGNYQIKPSAPGYQPVPVSVIDRRTTTVTR